MLEHLMARWVKALNAKLYLFKEKSVNVFKLS